MWENFFFSCLHNKEGSFYQKWEQRRLLILLQIETSQVEGCGPGDLIITYETISVGEHIIIFKADLQMYF